MFIERAPHFSDRDRRFEQVLSGDGSPANDVVRIDRCELRIEIFATIGRLDRRGIPIAGWAAFEDITDINLFPLQLTGLDDLI